jgi:tricorn protease
MVVSPVAEWRQIFNGAWHIERDLFRDPDTHGVGWKKMRERYGKLLGEMNCSHPNVAAARSSRRSP